jgi:MFS transporter, DHA1 family, tetracycline resistance protein
VQGGLIEKARKRLGERKMILLGLCCGIAGFTAYGSAASAYWFWAAIPVMALWGLAGPAVQSLSSQMIGPTEQGRMSGAINSLSSLANIFGPILFTHLFNSCIHSGGRERSVGLELPGAPFYLSAFALVLALWVALRLTKSPANAVAPASTKGPVASSGSSSQTMVSST